MAMVSADGQMIPFIRDMLERMSGCLLFGEFDLDQAYLQFPLDEASQQYTVFT